MAFYTYIHIAMKKIITAVAVAATAMVGIAENQSPNSHPVSHTVFVNGNDSNRAASDSVDSLLEQFYQDQYRQYYDPHAPYFMFLTKDANLAMGIGGRVLMRGWYDWNGVISGPNFFPYDIPVPPDPANRHDLGASFNSTTVFLTVLGRNTRIGTYMLYVQAGVKNKNFALKKAYMKINDWTVGYAPSTFNDDGAQPATVDAAGCNGAISKTSVLVRYFHTFKNGISLAGGAEIPSSDQNDIEGETAKCADYVPDIVGLVQYGWDGGDSHVRASGILRVMSYRDLLTAKNNNVVGWGAQLSGRWQIVKPFALYLQGIIGQGVGSYTGDLSEGSYDLVPRREEPGGLIAPLSLGLTAGLEYAFSERWIATLALGECRYFERHNMNADEYKYGLYGAANVMYNITPRIQTGLEYVVGKRMNFDGAHAGLNRADILLSFSF